MRLDGKDSLRSAPMVKVWDCFPELKQMTETREAAA